jgi:hypothetical protein
LLASREKKFAEGIGREKAQNGRLPGIARITFLGKVIGAFPRP